ncbi:actin-3-like [Ambystoma mexicanum]|uniref:actin-3-like n=1 Tax=Ambystoma mexicanum TaxID=8296 RepID=UPI0037E8F3ED
MSSLIERKSPSRNSTSLVLDIGSSSCKAGFSGDAIPRAIVESVIGYLIPKVPKSATPDQQFLGGDAVRAVQDLTLVEFVKDGVIIDWDAAEILWRHILEDKLGVHPEEYAVLITDSAHNPASKREVMAEILFEHFNVCAMHVAHQPVLAMYSYGRTTALVVDCGHVVSQTVPVHEGYVLPHAIERMDLAGLKVTKYLEKHIQQQAHHLISQGTHMFDEIKHKCCYVATDFEAEIKLNKQNYLMNYELPDGHVVSIGKERFEGPELLFGLANPGSAKQGIQHLTSKSLKKIPPALRKDMCDNILLCGGSTMISGFSQRFNKEVVNTVAPKAVKPKVHAMPQREHSSWRGGSILTSLMTFGPFWVPLEDYKENGPSIIHRKCY